MSRQQRCPICEKLTEHAALGVVMGKNLFQCKVKGGVEQLVDAINGSSPTRGCGGLWEEIVIQQPIKKNDPIRKVLV
jgi:hypothetical protein